MPCHQLRKWGKDISSIIWWLRNTPAQSVKPGARVRWYFGEVFYIQQSIGEPLAHDGEHVIYSAVLQHVQCESTIIRIPPCLQFVKVALGGAEQADLEHCPFLPPTAGDIEDLVLQCAWGQAEGHKSDAPTDVQARVQTALESTPLPHEFEPQYVSVEAEVMHICKDDEPDSWKTCLELSLN
ncbi:unnamed protein product [Peniophora sp. CBMAI 1063]|nr:unnamed protein product [Peniophora sp. CBMAI 1063]